MFGKIKVLAISKHHQKLSMFSVSGQIETGESEAEARAHTSEVGATPRLVDCAHHSVKMELQNFKFSTFDSKWLSLPC